MKKNKKNKTSYELVLNSKIYPLSAIFGAAYIFINKAYILFDGDPNKQIKVSFKSKPETNSEVLENIVGEFKNELLNYALREQIVKSNQKIRETIIAQALLSPLYDTFSDFAEEASEEDQIEDPLGITETWEEHFGKKEKLAAKKSKNAKT
ncbi:MAG: His-Xaa-Ser system protein HxsD [Patescibacteria group bacterium]|nr:His-Xaa-Ser system protein HxsD [Patescibacteria group bacterium]